MDKDNEGNIWTASKNGIIKISSRNYELGNYNIDVGENLNKDITKVLCDSKGNVWFASSSGLIKYILSNNKIYVSSITSFLQDSENDLWIGTEQNGVIYFNVDEDKMIRFNYNENDENSLSSN